jgi:hypothetical protein
VLDDGSHVGRHQVISFQTLWPLLSEGGLYVIEDTHTAYWPETFEGGYRRVGSAIEFAKTLIYDRHHWHHHKGDRDDVKSVSFHDSIILIEKRKNEFPVHVRSGGGGGYPE